MKKNVKGPLVEARSFSLNEDSLSTEQNLKTAVDYICPEVSWFGLVDRALFPRSNYWILNIFSSCFLLIIQPFNEFSKVDSID